MAILWALIGPSALSAQIGAEGLRGVMTAGDTAQVKSAMADFTNDWTALSPRRACLGSAGLRNKTSVDAEREEPQEQDHLLRQDMEGSLVYQIDAFNRSKRSGGRYRDVLKIGFLPNLGEMAAAPNPDRRRMVNYMAMISRLLPFVPDSVISNGDALDGDIALECAREYLAVAYGIGAADGEARYASAITRWTKEHGAEPSYYSHELVALNYLVARERLARGDEAGAFALASGPVIGWATKNLEYATNWRASFYVSGIGTPRSVPKAIAVFDAGLQSSDKIESAILKASIGRQAEAAAQLRDFMAGEWKGSTQFARANKVYAAITGQTWRAPNFLDVMIAVPLALASYCFQHPDRCPGAGAGQGSNQPIYGQKDIDDARKAQRDAFEFQQNWREVQTWKF